VAFLRAFRLALVLAVFVIIAAPLQWVIVKFAPSARASIPMLFHRAICGAMGVRVRVIGAPSPARPQLVVANHVSWLDISALASRHPLWFFAKTEVGQWPVVGQLARLQGCLFVNRSRWRAIPAVNRQLADSLRQGFALVLFPEATTGDGNRLRKFHTSHFQAAIAASGVDAPACLQPVSITYTCRNGLPYDRLTRPSIAWYGDMELLPHLWEILQSGPIDCELRYGPPIPVAPDGQRKALASLACAKIQAGIAAAREGAADALEN
jgi:lyso-ornithine lipid O-acyltransferase